MPTEPLPAAADDDISDGPPRAVLIAAVAIAVVAIGAVLAIAATRHTPTQPVAIASVPAPQSDSADCRTLVNDLPDRLGDVSRAPAVEPVPAGAAAWRAEPDGDAVILRCGIDRPAEFVVGSPIQMVDQVQWFRLDDPAADRSTWVAVDRPVYVALTLPSGSGPSPIQTVSDLIARTLPQVAIRPGAAS